MVKATEGLVQHAAMQPGGQLSEFEKIYVTYVSIYETEKLSESNSRIATEC